VPDHAIEAAARQVVGRLCLGELLLIARGGGYVRQRDLG
jgi:hypothetical protein